MWTVNIGSPDDPDVDDNLIRNLVKFLDYPTLLSSESLPFLLLLRWSFSNSCLYTYIYHWDYCTLCNKLIKWIMMIHLILFVIKCSRMSHGLFWTCGLKVYRCKDKHSFQPWSIDYLLIHMYTCMELHSSVHPHYTALQSQKAVSAYLWSKQIPPCGLARQYTMLTCLHRLVVTHPNYTMVT